LLIGGLVSQPTSTFPAKEDEVDLQTLVVVVINFLV